MDSCQKFSNRRSILSCSRWVTVVAANTRSIRKCCVASGNSCAPFRATRSTTVSRTGMSSRTSYILSDCHYLCECEFLELFQYWPFILLIIDPTQICINQRGPQGGLLYWGTRKMGFLRDMQNGLQVNLPLYRGPFGEPGGGCLVGLLREMNSISEYLSLTRRSFRF